MNKHTIAAIGLDLEKSLLIEAKEEANSIHIEFFSGPLLDSKEHREKTLEFVKKEAQAVIIKEFSGKVSLEKFYLKLKEEAGDIPIIPIGPEAIQAGISCIDINIIQEINRYFAFGGKNNYINSLLFILSEILGDVESIAVKPEPLAFEGIFHPDSERVFSSWESYSKWYQERFACVDGRWIGLLFHRNNWVNNNLEVEKLLIKELERQGLQVIAVFNENRDFEGIINNYFFCNGRLIIDALINLQLFIFKGDSTGEDVFKKAVDKLEELNIPVFRPLISYMNSEESWEESQGLTMEIPWAFTTPEAQGMIEPILVGCRDKEGKAHPIGERVVKFAQRVKKWTELKNTENKEKKLAVFIHNAPCSGVEATIGMGAGLDVFTSTAAILKKLKQTGWKVENVPQDGNQLYKLIMEKKAYSDFRWTSVEAIIESGGCLYKMSLDEYYRYYEKLEPVNREEMEKTWGLPPGEGMVYNNELVITGISFGNVTVLVQPKRGCYGAKCTGEICKILQDPSCPPPHQYLATYKYAEEILKVQAILHIGTHGSLEFLPGKTNALSKKCYPDIVLGAVPNFYIYNAGVGTEGVLAKRRTSAVILDHLPPIYGAQDTEIVQLIDLINNYFEALSLKSEQAQILKEEIHEQASKIPGALSILEKTKTFSQGLIKLKNVLVQSVCNPKVDRLHIYGQETLLEDALWYIKEVLQSDVKLMKGLKSWKQDDYNLHCFLTEFIKQTIIAGGNGSIIAEEISGQVFSDELKDVFDDMAVEIREIHNKLALQNLELDNLLAALGGGYILPGPSGMPDDNGKNIIPTGRNFYIMDIDKVPTKAAWEVGCRLAEQLIELYVEEEGSYPEKIAMNMISLDISRSKGEQLSQILYLMGIRPVWDTNGKVIDLEVIPLEELNRPRIDVTIRISGVLRDCYPQAVELIDSAVVMAAALSEQNDKNFVKKHAQQITKVLEGMGENSELMRRSTMRIFGDRPGTYGAGVDLALKASAWKDELDLAKVFVYFSSYAYGKNLNGRQAKHEFVENIKKAQIAYDTSTSKRHDILASGFGASVQGGFNLIKKVMQGKEIKQYHGSRENPEQVKVGRSDEKLRETLEETLFNPLWKENMQQKGYRGASELMQRLQHIFDWQCLSQSFENNDLDRLVEEYVNDPETRKWFSENNLFAIEEIARRFLELHQRGKWQADPDVLEELKSNYLELEGDMEERLGDFKGEIQAGNIEVMNDADVKEWQDKLKEVNELFDK